MTDDKEIVKKLLKRYSLDEKAVKKWAKEKYPDYAENLKMMISMYLQEKQGIKLDPYELGMVKPKEHVDVRDLENRVFSQIRVLISGKISEFEYNACPECNSKVDDDNECDKHGKVKPVLVAWKKYTAGDKTGDVIFTLPPTTSFGGVLVNETVEAEGSFREDRGEFVVRSLRVISDGNGDTSETLPTPPEAEAEEEPEAEWDGEVNEEEVQALKDFVDIYGGAPEGTIASWVASKEFTTPLKELIKAAKLKKKKDKYYVE